MEEKKIICIVCPIGCNLTVKGEGDRIESIEGNECKRGEKYGRDEFISPVRILTSTVKVENAQTPLIPVRSSKPVPRQLLLKCMEEIRKLNVKTPVKRYDILVPDILGTGADIVATGDVE